jgi:glycosyltransferase involved in cell wall biosynthesis
VAAAQVVFECFADFCASHSYAGLVARRKLKPDLVCTHSSKAGVLGRLAAHRCGIPSVFTAHGWAFTEGVPAGKRRFYADVERLAARCTSKIICVSDYDRSLALRWRVAREEQLVTVHNGIPDVGEDLVAQPGTGTPVRVIMVARFATQKDQDLLIRAVAALKGVPDFEVELVGDGPLMQQSQALAAKLGASDRVSFSGAQTDVVRRLARSHVFVLASRSEGLPLTVLEAMRAGLPVIASDVGGVSEAVEDGITGFLVPRGDEESLRQRLRWLLQRPEERVRMGRAGRERFLQQFTVERMVRRTEGVYREVLGR